MKKPEGEGIPRKGSFPAESEGAEERYFRLSETLTDL